MDEILAQGKPSLLTSTSELKTGLSESVEAGTTILPVFSTNGFLIGRQILIGVGTPLMEANVEVG